MATLNPLQQKNTKTSRPLSASERVFIALDKLYTPFVNQLVVEGAGAIAYESLQAAVESASTANPGSRLVLRGRLGFSSLVDSGITPPVKIIEAGHWSGNSPEGADFLLDPLPLRTGPACEVLLLMGDTTRIVFRTHHAIMDGGGTLLWANDIFHALNDRELTGSTLGLTDTQVAKSIKSATTVNWNRIYPAPTGQAKGDEEGITWRRVHVQGRHSMLLAKVAQFVAQKARSYPQEIIHIAIPVDMRRHIGVQTNTGNLTGFVHIMVSQHSSEEEITAQVRDKLQQHEYAALNRGTALCSHLPISVLASGMQKAANTMKEDSLFGGSAVLSNLGMLNLEAFETSTFKPSSGFFIPPGTGASPLFMALAGNHRGIELVAAMPKYFASHGRLDQLMEELASFIADKNTAA